MKERFEYRFTEEIPMDEAEQTMLVAVVAAEGLHGRSKVRMEARFRFHTGTRTCEIDASTEVGRDLARIYTGLLEKRFGEENFRVERIGNDENEEVQA